MAASRPRVDLRAIPRDLDAIIDWLEAWSYGLVLLEEYPLPDIELGVGAVSSAVESHCREAESRLRAPLGFPDAPQAQLARVVRHDHEWFATSVQQFQWFLNVVRTEDHGGHRQALGQFGRVLAESLRRHRRDERWLEESAEPAPDGRLP